MMALNFAAISAGATGVRSAASEAKAKAVPIACGALLCGAIAVPSQIDSERSITPSPTALPLTPYSQDHECR